MGAGEADLIERRLISSGSLVISNPESLSEVFDAFFKGTSDEQIANMDGHLDPVAIEALRNAVSSSNALEESTSATTMAFTVAESAATMEALAESMDRLPGPFRNLAKVPRLAGARLMRIGNRMAALTAMPTVQRMHHHLVVHNWARQRINAQAEKLVPQPAKESPGEPHAPPAKVTELAPLQSQINDLQRKVQALAYAVGAEQHSGSVPITFTDQIRALQRDVNGLQHFAVAASTDINTLRAHQSAVEQVLTSLSVHLAGIATLTETWPNILHELQTAIKTLEQDYSQTATRVQTNTQALAHLSPLGLLLQPGAKGVKTLRQLEDTPCMCPKIPTPHIDLGLLMAEYEFISNG